MEQHKVGDSSPYHWWIDSLSKDMSNYGTMFSDNEKEKVMGCDYLYVRIVNAK